MNEKLLERKLREAVKRVGGLALKWVSPSTNGVPDRIIILPGGRVRFVELKSTGEPLRASQESFFPKLAKVDQAHEVIVIDTQEKLDNFLMEI